MRIAGVMSGTSLDGIDVAVVEMSGIEMSGEVRGQQVKTIGFTSTAYPEKVRKAILEVSNAVTTTAAISRLNFQLGELYARAIQGALRRYGKVELIGCHGQTIYHEGRQVGRSNTMQIGEAAVIAERTGLPVVSNFRVRDIAAGGQGAPLVPFVDYLLFRHPRRTRIALNIGGIGNITVIPAGGAPGSVVAFDTGPGNMVIDALAREFSKGKLSCDRGGRIAAGGKVHTVLLDELLRDPYYRRKPPKSAGREQYGAEFIARLKSRSKADGLPLRDLVATATVLTPATIALAVRPFVKGPTDLIVSGGGVHNPRIMAHLTGFLPEVNLSIATDHGIDADAKEAIAFAVLAYETWRRKPSNLPSATGASRAVVLGTITP